MKKTFCLLSGIVVLVVLCSCQCEHTWINATCDAPVTCSQCGETAGEALGHAWQAATCTTPKTCSTCKAIEGTAIGHVWWAATCTTPQTCSVCKTTEGTTVDHVWQTATCTTPQTCSVCKTTEGTANEHVWQDATCTTPQTCSVCHVVAGLSTGHVWRAATCSTPKTCSVCKVTEGTTVHRWVAATCTTPKTCSACGKTDGSALGHTTGEKCSRCGEYTNIYYYLRYHIIGRNSNSKFRNGLCYTYHLGEGFTWRLFQDPATSALVIGTYVVSSPNSSISTEFDCCELYLYENRALHFFSFATYPNEYTEFPSGCSVYGDGFIDPVEYSTEYFSPDSLSFAYFMGDNQEKYELSAKNLIYMALTLMDDLLSRKFSSSFSSADLGFSLYDQVGVN